MKENKLLIQITCSCPDLSIAETIKDQLIQTKQAACVQISPSITSHYLWNGHIESANEVLLQIKTLDQAFDACEDTIKKLHPYEVPEIIATTLHRVSSDYAEWVRNTLS